MNTLKYVRPGNGFEPKFHVFGKVDVNGKDAHDLFRWMRNTIPIPDDPPKDTRGLGMNDSHVLCSSPLWSPVSRSDVAW